MRQDNTCSMPPPLTDDQLLDVLENKQSPLVDQHLQACVYCAERLRSFQEFDASVSNIVERIDCPDSSILTDYVMERIPKPDQAILESHLKICLACQEEIQLLRGFLADDLSADAPLGTLSRPNPRKPPVTEYIAVLSKTQAIAALRGKTRGPIILSAADDIDIILEHHESAGRSNIMGQLLVDDIKDWQGAQIQIHDDKELLGTAILDALGTFESDFQAGLMVTIRIIAPSGMTITIPDIVFEE